MSQSDRNIQELTHLRGLVGVFRDRAYAGQLLAAMLAAYRDADTLLLAIPAGGVPVAAEIARRLRLPLDVAVVSKLTPPWNTETGYGAVAFDGTVHVNAEYVAHFGLSDRDVRAGVGRATTKVQRRLKRFRGDAPFPELHGRPVIVVDDGLASGATLRVALGALRNHGADRLIVAVPTGHSQSLDLIASEIEALYCANIRSGFSFAVADAYAQWYDVSEDEVADVLEGLETGPHTCIGKQTA